MSASTFTINLNANDQTRSGIQGAIANVQNLDNAVKNSMRQRTSALQKYNNSLATQENIQKRIDKLQSKPENLVQRLNLQRTIQIKNNLINNLTQANKEIDEAIKKSDISKLQKYTFFERNYKTRKNEPISFFDKLNKVIEKDKTLNEISKSQLKSQLSILKTTGIPYTELKSYAQNINFGKVKEVKENTQKINDIKKELKNPQRELNQLNKANTFYDNQQTLLQNQIKETQRLSQDFQTAQNKIPTDIKNLREELTKSLSNGILKEEINRIKQSGKLSKRELRRANRVYNGTVRSIRGLFNSINLPIDVRSATLTDFNSIIGNKNVGFRKFDSNGKVTIVPLTPQQQEDYRNLFRLSTELVDQKDLLSTKNTNLLSTKNTIGEFSGFKRNHPYGVGYLNYGFPTVSQKQIEFQQRQQEINNANMSLYATSHAMKAIEGTLQQGYEVGKGNIDEYVRFQSATVGVAKLLPVLRDKDTLLVNERFNEFRQGILDMTENLPRSGVELAQASEVAARLGVTNPDQIRKVVEAGTKLGVAFGMAPNEVTNNIVKIANAKGIDINKSGSMEKIMEFADAINYLDDHTAASGREIINFTKKAVQTAEGVKMDTKDVSAFGASLVSLGISSDQANTAFKNLMTVLQTGARNRKTGNEYLEKSGYTVKQLTTEFKKNPTKTAVEFIKRLNKLRDNPAGSDAAAIVRFAFGQMSAQGIMALVNNPEVLEKYLKMARSDSLNWTEKEFQARQKNDPAVQFKLLDNAVKKLQIDTGEMLMPIAQAFINDIKSFTKQISPAVKEHGDILRTGAYAGLGLLGLTKVGGFITDTAMLSNNLRNFKWYNDFVKSKYKTNKLSYNAPMILTNGELINGVWNKGASVKNNRNLWNRFSFRAGVYGGKKDFLQLYRQFGKMRNNPAMYSNGKAIGELAQVTKAMNAMKWKGGLQAGLAFLPTLFSVPVLAGLAGIGTASYFTSNYVSKQIDKNFAKQTEKQEAIKGTLKERKSRANRPHSNVFQYEKLHKLQDELNKRGYEVANVNGELVVNKLFDNGKKKRVLEDIERKQHEDNSFRLFGFKIIDLPKGETENRTLYLQEGTNAEKIGLSKGDVITTEQNNPKLLAIIDEIKRLKLQQASAEARAGIKPEIRDINGVTVRKDTSKQLYYEDPVTGEIISHVDKSNFEAWHNLRNEQIQVGNKRVKQEIEKQKLQKAIQKATNDYDATSFYDLSKKLKDLQYAINITDKHEKDLQKTSSEVDWQAENGYSIYKTAPVHSLDRKHREYAKRSYQEHLQQLNLTPEQERLYLLLDEKEWWEQQRKTLGQAKRNKEAGIKDSFDGKGFMYDVSQVNPEGTNGYIKANDKLYVVLQEIKAIIDKNPELKNNQQKYSDIIKNQEYEKFLETSSFGNMIKAFKEITNQQNVEKSLTGSFKNIDKGIESSTKQLKTFNDYIDTNIKDKTVTVAVKVNTSQAETVLASLEQRLNRIQSGVITNKIANYNNYEEPKKPAQQRAIA